jgi:low affinity Fe/Cu permease
METFEQALTFKWKKSLRKVLKTGPNRELSLEEAKEKVVKKMMSTVQNKLNEKFDELVKRAKKQFLMFLDCEDSFCGRK